MKIFKLFKVFIGKIEGKVRTYLSILTGKNFTKPEELYYFISQKCNFRCQMCTTWKDGLHEDLHKNLTIEQVKNVIDQAAAWKIKNFGVCGGEPLLFKDKLLAILEYANKKGLYTHFVTNGWLLDEDFLKKYDQIGGGHISLSCDAANLLHDELRGMPGAYAHVQKALEIFAKVNPRNILLKINLVVSDKNLDEILNVVKLTEKNNASIFLQPYDPCNWTTRNSLDQKQYHGTYPLWVSEVDNAKLEKVINEIVNIKERKPSLILNSIEHLKAFPTYFSLKTKLDKCYIGFKSLFINNNGDIVCCKFGTLGNVLNSSLKEIWNSKAYQDLRKAALKCNFNCLLGCMYNPSIFSWIKSGLHLILKKKNENIANQ
jgi:MoaA/NifB/PqqE/SkfB family radical SAM enzyme